MYVRLFLVAISADFPAENPSPLFNTLIFREKPKKGLHFPVVYTKMQFVLYTCLQHSCKTSKKMQKRCPKCLLHCLSREWPSSRPPRSPSQQKPRNFAPRESTLSVSVPVSRTLIPPKTFAIPPWKLWTAALPNTPPQPVCPSFARQSARSLQSAITSSMRRNRLS